MQSKILYIENKSSLQNEAWIGFAEFSKSGQTVYFNDKAFKKLKIGGISGNHFDIETSEEYWISGVKKNGKDRHHNANGKILIDKNCVEEYLKFVDSSVLDQNKFTIIEIAKTDENRFNELENNETEFRDESRNATFYDNNRRKLTLDQ